MSNNSSDKSLNDGLDAVRKMALEKEAEVRRNTPLVKQLDRPGQLPLPWFDDVGIQSSSLVKGSLFSARSSRVKRVLRDNFAVMMQGDTVAYITGAELRQDEATILAKLVDLNKNKPLGERITFTPYSMLMELGWSDNKTNYRRLYDSLKYMRGTLISLFKADSADLSFDSKTLLSHFDGRISAAHAAEGENLPVKKEVGKRDVWSVQLDPALADLYQRENVTLFDWNMRKAIQSSRSEIAQWLFSFYCEHRHPIPYQVSHLQQLAGLEEMEPRAASQAIKRGCQILVNEGFLESFFIKNGTLTVTRSNDRKRLRSSGDNAGQE